MNKRRWSTSLSGRGVKSAVESQDELFIGQTAVKTEAAILQTRSGVHMYHFLRLGGEMSRDTPNGTDLAKVWKMRSAVR